MAKSAVNEKDYEEAKRLSEEALVDAQLARAKSYSKKSEVALKEINDSIDLMRDEISRAQGS
jgi:hypothetical protein